MGDQDAGGVGVREILSRDFEFRVIGKIGIGVHEETSKVLLRMYAASVDENGNPLPLPPPLEGTPCAAGWSDYAPFSSLSPDRFRAKRGKPAPTDEEIAAWAQQVFEQAHAGIPLLTTAVAIEYMDGVANLADRTGHPDDYDEEEVIAGVLRLVEYYLREMLGTRRRGSRSKWTKHDLAAELKAMRRLLPAEDHTFPKVAEAMKQRNPERAPPSGAALRALCDRHGLKVGWLRRREGKRKVSEKRTPK